VKRSFCSYATANETFPTCLAANTAERTRPRNANAVSGICVRTTREKKHGEFGGTDDAGGRFFVFDPPGTGFYIKLPIGYSISFDLNVFQW